MRVFDADSDQFAHIFRSDVARDSDFKSLTIPISNRSGKRSSSTLIL
jgi:hypothetical protein